MNSKLLRRVLAFAAVLLSGLFAQDAQSEEPEGDLDGWELEQKLRIVGKIDLFVCRSAVRIDFPKSGMVFVATSPWKEAYFYCRRTGHMFKTSFRQVSSPYAGTMDLADGCKLSQLKAVFRCAQVAAGIPGKLFVEPPGQEERLKALYKSGELTARMPAKLKYIVSDYFKTPPEIGAVISRIYILPETESVPLQFSFTNLVHEPGVELTTYSCKPARLSRNVIAPPRGLKAVKDARLVIVPENAQDDSAMNLMLMERKPLR
jgi:hypothetical protein